jgi:formate C-acetyltransferase
VDDCILKGKDYHDGGPRYDSSYIQGVGMGTVTDCLSAIKYHVYVQKTLTMGKILEMLDADFAGFERE